MIKSAQRGLRFERRPRQELPPPLHLPGPSNENYSVKYVKFV